MGSQGRLLRTINGGVRLARPARYVRGGKVCVGIDPTEIPDLERHIDGPDSSRSEVNRAPKRTVKVASFVLDEVPVSRGEFLEFILGLRKVPLSHASQIDVAYWEQFSKSELYDDRAPIVGVTYEEANLYAWFHGGRLPTEWEWELAARGFAPSSVSYRDIIACSRLEEIPDDDPDWLEKVMRPIYKALLDPRSDALTWRSPFGVLSMVGNADEWVSGIFDVRTVEPAWNDRERPWEVDAEYNRILKLVGCDRSYPHPGRRGIISRESFRHMSSNGGNLSRIRSAGFRCAYDLVQVYG